MPMNSTHSDIVGYVKIGTEDMRVVRQLANQWNVTSRDVGCYAYLLLLVQYTGIISYQINTVNGNTYTFCFEEFETVQKNFDSFCKKRNPCGQVELSLRECESLSFEYTYWIESRDDSMVIGMNLKNIAAIVPPYFKQHFIFCLNAIIQEESYLYEMNLITGSEKSIIERFQNMNKETTLKYVDRTISEMFTKIVNERSANCAVEMQGHTLTYYELEQYSDQAAVALKSKGVKRNCIVGVILGTDIDLIIWILGIIKLQAVYMPVDAETPDAGVKHMLRESKAEYVISTNDKAVEGLHNVVFIDKYLYKKHMANERISEKKGALSDWAYIIYTSGSTGRPKGITVSHSNLIHQILALKEWGGFPEYATSLLAAHNCFDVSLQQIFYPLLTGGTVIILPHEMKMNARKVIQYINERNIGIVNFVPSYLEVLLETANEPMKCEVLLVGGEVFKKQLFTLIRQRVMAKKVCNIYGPTETTINTSIHICDLEKQYETIPIGKPLMFYRTYVVNRWNKQVPIGVNGELYIAGQGVTQGYIYQSEMTEEKFVHIDNLDSGRIYKSGDIVSLNTDGELLFIGRMDLQVKIRGKRFEIEEVERVILEYGNITDVVVILIEERFPKLVAYFTAREVVERCELKKHLGRHLLKHMIPFEFVQLESMPITDRGKVDRNLLKKQWEREENRCQKL